MAADVTFRPLTASDAPAVHDLAQRAFLDLSRRLTQEPWPDQPAAVAHLRIRHLAGTDPEGAVVAELGGAPVGAALATVREGIWGLSLLVVDPDVQSAGVGSALLARSVAYGAGARGGIILSSEDRRALRAYARAGFALHPSIEASGVPRATGRPADVRDGDLGDAPLADAVDRAVRGASHGPDLAAMLEAGLDLLVVDGRGYAVVGGGVRLLAAHDDQAAQNLLRAALDRAAGRHAMVLWITALQQDWALPVLLDAGLELKPGGAVFVRGDVGRFRPYLPSGAYL